MDEVNQFPSVSPSTSSATAPHLVSDDPPYIDIHVDVEEPPVPSRDSPSAGSDGADSISVHLGSPLSLSPPQIFPQQCVFNRPRVVTVFAVATSIIFLVLLVIFSFIANRGQKNHSCIINLLVSKNGKSDFTTVAEAVDAAPSYSPYKVCIVIRKGEYHEVVKIGHDKTNLVFMGDGIGKTIISSNASSYSGLNSWPVATLWVNGAEFLARDLTIINTAKYGVAIENWADHSIFFRCNFEGSNLTLHAKGQTQFYRDCHIYGKHYLVSGNAAAFFQKCEFFHVKLYHKEKSVFFGQSRDFWALKTGFIFHRCSFYVADSSLNSPQTVFLGSALGEYAFVVVMQSYLDASITGYYIDSPPNTAYFAIFGNTGLVAAVENIPPSIHTLGAFEAESKFSLRGFLGGFNWIPREVEYDLDLI